MEGAKRISIFVILILLTLSFLQEEAYAATTDWEVLSASVNVISIFDMSSNQPSLNFGNMDATTPPFTVGPKYITLSCQTNNNSLWEVSAELTSPLTSGIFTIPNQNFHWQPVPGAEKGSWNTGTGFLDIIFPHTFYSATDPTEWIISSPVDLTLQFDIDVPPSQAAGLYTTSIIFKMTEMGSGRFVEETTYVSVGVLPVFSISAQPVSIHFGTVDPGVTTNAEDLYVACSTNNNAPWDISIRVDSELTHESYSYTIPNNNFHWYGNGGAGTWFAQSGVLSTTAFPFYESGSGEYGMSAPVVELFMNFYIEVPPAQVAGRYTTTIILTMAEK